MTDIICGVDAAAATLEARIGHQHGPWQQFPRTGDGIAALASFCQHHRVALLVMEATAQAMGLLEKTDRLDAGVIAWYAQVKHVIAQPPAAATQLRLAACVTRLRQLTELRVAQTNQRRLVNDPDVLAAFDVMLALLASQIRRFEQMIAAAIAADPLWAALDAAFRAIKGVADRTVARLMAELPEIGTLSGKAITKLAGLAPIANDSGQHSGRRSVRGGRRGVRSVLFIVAEVVRRYDPDFHAFAQRLKAAGKPPKVIRVALAHKLLVRLNAKARDVRNNLPCPP